MIMLRCVPLFASPKFKRQTFTALDCLMKYEKMYKDASDLVANFYE